MTGSAIPASYPSNLNSTNLAIFFDNTALEEPMSHKPPGLRTCRAYIFELKPWTIFTLKDRELLPLLRQLPVLSFSNPFCFVVLQLQFKRISLFRQDYLAHNHPIYGNGSWRLTGEVLGLNHTSTNTPNLVLHNIGVTRHGA